MPHRGLYSTAYSLALMLATAVFAQTPSLVAQDATSPLKPEPSLVEKEVSVPMPPSSQLWPQIAPSHGMDVLEVYYKSTGKLPLALLTHGTPEYEHDRTRITPWAYLEQARWFARRGYFVFVVVRSGYGRTGGIQDVNNRGCGVGNGHFQDIGSAAAMDLELVVEFARKLSQVDSTRIVSAGVSTGGYAQLALVADRPRGLKAAINFGGGVGHDGNEHNCDLPVATASFKGFGKGARKHGDVPTLWIFAQNDHWYPPRMAKGFEEAYRDGGGASQLVLAPPYGSDGHDLFSDVSVWSDSVQAFLKLHGLLPLGDTVLPLPKPPDTPMPPGLTDANTRAWEEYLLAAPYKALAIDDHGATWAASGEFDQPAADYHAMERCRSAKSGRCTIVAKTSDVN